jgi:purine-nucleoside/S-methyl-5'-thioadenosine phosphorylase / adenosine deaminase
MAGNVTACCREEIRGSHSFLTIPEVEHLDSVSHVFTSRRNGLGSRNNGVKQPDDWNDVAGFFGIDAERIITVNQVHRDHVVTVDSGNYRRLGTMQADAMISRSPGIAIGVETADCVPVLLVDPGTPAIAAIHAGWRSTVKKIVQKTVRKMKDEFGTDPAGLTAAIGPAIGPECYEVDEPVMGPVREAFPFWREVTVPRGSDRWSLDLVKANVIELIHSGVREDHIHSLGLCTSCRSDLFYSFRAEGRTGRMLSAIIIRG